MLYRSGPVSSKRTQIYVIRTKEMHTFFINDSIILSSTGFEQPSVPEGRSQWPRGLRRRSSAARLPRLWVRIPPEAWMFVCCECCVLSGSGLCDGLITRPEESYRLWRVVVCDQETSKTRRLKPATGAVENTMGCNAKEINNKQVFLRINTWLFETCRRQYN